MTEDDIADAISQEYRPVAPSAGYAGESEAERSLAAQATPVSYTSAQPYILSFEQFMATNRGTAHEGRTDNPSYDPPEQAYESSIREDFSEEEIRRTRRGERRI